MRRQQQTLPWRRRIRAGRGGFLLLHAGRKRVSNSEGGLGMKLSYRNQIILTCAILLLFNVLNTAFKNWIFTNIGFVLCGLLWMVHPVMTKNVAPTKKNRRIVRISGAVLVLLGIFTRAYFY